MSFKNEIPFGRDKAIQKNENILMKDFTSEISATSKIFKIDLKQSELSFGRDEDSDFNYRSEDHSGQMAIRESLNCFGINESIH